MKRTPRSSSQPDVIIVGGSLAGLLTAHTLADVGIASTVLERAGAHRPSGAALAVDAGQLLRVLGSARAAAALGRDPQRGDGSLPESWSRLHQGLLGAATADPLISVRHSSAVSHVEQNASRAQVALRSGETLSADAVIGADGYRSVVRGEVDPARPDAVFAGYTLWLGTVDEECLPARSTWPRTLDFRSGGGHYLLGYPLAGEDGAAQPGKRRLGWAWYDATRNGLLRAAGSVKGHTVQHSLRPSNIPAGVYADLERETRLYWPSPWRDAILNSISRRDVVCTPISEYVPETLARGRLALVGDAAHVPTPMTGRGFATSVDDADTLAAALRDSSPRTVPDALDAYAKARLAPARELVQSGQGFSRGFGR